MTDHTKKYLYTCTGECGIEHIAWGGEGDPAPCEYCGGRVTVSDEPIPEPEPEMAKKSCVVCRSHGYVQGGVIPWCYAYEQQVGDLDHLMCSVFKPKPGVIVCATCGNCGEMADITTFKGAYVQVPVRVGNCEGMDLKFRPVCEACQEALA